MRLRNCTLGLIAAYVTFPAHSWAADLPGAVVDFEDVGVGTVYGAASNDDPGVIVLTRQRIDMSMEVFRLGAASLFFRAEVGGKFDDLVPTTGLELNNINARFDFSRLNSQPILVTIDYWEFGGDDNFAVNDAPAFELDQLSNLPGIVAPGVTATVSDSQIVLIGAIDSVLIGGQELVIDNIRAIPEPSVALLAILGATTLLRRGSRRAQIHHTSP